MARMMGGQKDAPLQGMQAQADGAVTHQPSPTLNPDERLMALRTQLDDVEGQIQRIAAADRPAASRERTGIEPAMIGHGTNESTVR